MIQYYISEITLVVCKPYECPDQNYLNEKQVHHFLFVGDGPIEGHTMVASEGLVRDYMSYCKQQVMLSEMYLSLSEKKKEEKRERGEL